MMCMLLIASKFYVRGAYILKVEDFPACLWLPISILTLRRIFQLFNVNDSMYLGLEIGFTTKDIFNPTKFFESRKNLGQLVGIATYFNESSLSPQPNPIPFML